MPGIAGIADASGKVDLTVAIDRMCGVMKHHGWYTTSSRAGDNAALGISGPCIVAPKDQPGVNADGDLWAVIDGDVFNTPELAKGTDSDASSNVLDVLLHAYQRFGDDFAARLNGAFAIAIWDARAKKLVIANDRYGLRPIYYAHDSARFVLASEIKAVLENDFVSRGVDPQGVAEFFAFEYCLAENTLMESVRLLPPGSVATFQNGRLTIRKYWELEFSDAKDDVDEAGAADELSRLLKQSVARQMRGEQSKGILLSGGIDSRTVAGAIGNGPLPIPAATFGVVGCRDAEIAARIAHRLGARHHFFEMTPDSLVNWAERGVWLTDGMRSCVHFHGISVLDGIRKLADVMLTGVSFEFLRGKFLTPELLACQTEAQLAEAIHRDTNSAVGEQLAPKLFSEDFYQRVRGAAKQGVIDSLNRASAERLCDRIEHFYLRERHRRFILTGFLYTRTQFEDRNPFYDNDLFDFYLRMPLDFRLGGRLLVRALKTAAPELARLPTTHARAPLSAGAMGRALHEMWEKGVLWPLFRVRRKLGQFSGGLLRHLEWEDFQRTYAPYRVWLKTALRGFVTELLSDDRFRGRPYFNHQCVNELVRQHMSEEADHTEVLGVLITFELWHRLFLD